MFLSGLKSIHDQISIRSFSLNFAFYYDFLNSLIKYIISFLNLIMKYNFECYYIFFEFVVFFVETNIFCKYIFGFFFVNLYFGSEYYFVSFS